MIERRRINNILFWGLNVAMIAAIAVEPDELRSPWRLPTWLSLISIFLILDLWSYAWHRVLHVAPIGWRIHTLHHSDASVDLTTALRHHPAEALVATGLYWLIILALGFPAFVVMMHGAAVFAANALVHCKITIPSRIERLLALVFITPALHRAHHSIEYSNANFGELLSVWDRIFGTLQRAPATLTFGVAGLPQSSSLTGMFLTPWRMMK